MPSRLSRSLSLLRHLQEHGAARFGELLALLAPISRTTLSGLLAELVAEGEVEHQGRLYLPATRNILYAGSNIYQLPPKLRERVHPVLATLCQRTGHAAALFGRVGLMTMKILDEARAPGAGWRFAPAGYEWPLVPFHGFAKVFLAHAEENHARLCFERWRNHLRPELCPSRWPAFREELATIRRRGYALEYQEETQTLLRLVMPVPLSGAGPVCFALGLVARSVYLLNLKEYLPPLHEAREELRTVMAGHVPLFRFDLAPLSD